ncbi:hypothetical protein [Mesorhizobium sp. B2-5-7]|uniref:hypothetical protein n=1 Tax=Mesorhizobium sp. B2-5-7 TaxID=2589923 RepID=UPI001126CA55|nr:hypothetical protein [Mesorhizobium sp. B2-5-7]TPK18051.1 hypothetical protein FJ543_06075 [Mesorhizobium sp. B2-5-7]
MTIYTTGTVTVSNGSAVVTGSGTAWAIGLVTGGMLSSEGVSIPIASVTDDTHLTLAYVWPGTTAAGAAYAIQRDNSDAASVVDLYDKLSRVLVTLSLAGITPDNSGTLAKRNALTLAAANDNYLFLHAELGVAFAFYRWDGPSLSWIGPFAVANAVASGGVTSLVAGLNVTIDSTNPDIPVISASGTPMETAIHAATSKTTPVDADELGIADSAATFGLKKLTWANVKATLKSYFDTLYTSTTLARREVLTANRTYFVLTTGSDSNTGLVNSAGGAFASIQKAIDVASALDLSIYAVTIQCGTGTGGTTALNLKSFVGAGPITLQGDTVTPSNVTIAATSANPISAANVRGKWIVTGFKVTAATSGYGINVTSSQVDIGVIDFGACATAHINVEQGAIATFLNNYTISGASTRHWFVTSGALIQCVSKTVTLTGTPAFSSGFLIASNAGGALISGNTFTGSATGTRYVVSFNSWANVAGAGASYLPGNAAGSTATGGQYA